MGSDYILPKYSFDKPFDIKMGGLCHKEEQRLSKGPIWYTDGSQTDNGSGAGIHEKLRDMISMSHWGNIPRFSRMKYMQYEPVFRRISGGATSVGASTFYLIARLP
jgi:hypothetical protein